MDLIHGRTKFFFQKERAEFAVTELDRYLKRIAVPRPGTRNRQAEPTRIYIGTPDWCALMTGTSIPSDDFRDDGFFLSIRSSLIIIAAKCSRGMLFGAYELLERAGCRWFHPGPEGEWIPDGQGVTLQEGEWRSNPDFAIRGFTDGTHKEPTDAWIGEMLETIDWAAKVKCNAIFIHNDPTKPVQGWDILLPELRKRDMIVEVGGHGVQHFVDRSLFESKPELFREADGVRRKDGNFCPSNPEALRMVIGGAKVALASNPGIDVLHLWFDDVWGGSWCSCPLCAGKSAARQLAEVISAVADSLRTAAPGVKIDMLLYHDTLEAASAGVDLPDNVYGFFAPRERCYGHGIADPECARNGSYLGNLDRVVGAMGGNTYVFEYYDDMILFEKMKVNFPAVIREDLRGYRDAGVDKVTSLMFGRYSWRAYEFNMLAFARLAWDVEADYTTGLKDLCATLYPANTARMKRYFDDLESASAELLAFCGYVGNVNDIRNLEPIPPEWFDAHTEGIWKANRLFTACRKTVEACLAEPSLGAAEKSRLEIQAAFADLSVRESRAIGLQMKARMLRRQSGNDVAALGAMFDEAIAIEDAMKEWMEGIPAEIKGVAGGASIFGDHLCGDMAKIFRSMKRRTVG